MASIPSSNLTCYISPIPLLYASPNNPGALKVAEMLSRCAIGLRVEEEAPSVIGNHADDEVEAARQRGMLMLGSPLHGSKEPKPQERRTEPDLGETPETMPRKRGFRRIASGGNLRIPTLNEAKLRVRAAAAVVKTAVGADELSIDSPRGRNSRGGNATFQQRRKRRPALWG